MKKLVNWQLFLSHPIRRILRHLGSLAAACVISSLLPAGTGAQQGVTADIVGTVTDASSAAVVGATVTATNDGTGISRTDSSNQEGNYSFSLLSIGSYTVRVEAPGFETLVGHATLAAGDRVRVDASLKVGAQSQSVEVRAVQVALQTDSSDVGSTIVTSQAADLPLNGRNYTQLILLQPGVTPGSSQSMSSGNTLDEKRSTSSFSANGEPDSENSNYLDGLDNNERIQGGVGDKPSIDAIAEVKVETNMFSAEAGRTPGGVIDVITKSGTNAYHGSAYEFFHNDITDARNFFASAQQSIPKSLHLNQFGGSFGGPIIHNRTFFFVDVEDLRYIFAYPPTISTVPTAYEEAHPGDFSDVGGPVVSPSTFDQIGLAYFQMYPHPTSSATSNNFIYSAKQPQFSITGDVRVDHQFDSKNQIFIRFSTQNVSTIRPPTTPPVTLFGETIGTSQVLMNSKEGFANLHFNYVHVLSSNTLLELKAGYNRINIRVLPANYDTYISQKLGIANSNPNIFGSELTTVQPSGYVQLGDGNSGTPDFNVQDTFQYQGAITFARANHNIKTGAALIRRQVNQVQSGGAGTFVFGQGGFNSLIGLLQGKPTSLNRSNVFATNPLRYWEWSTYAQDDWRVKHWLTLNLGLRYDVYTPKEIANNHWANFDLNTFTMIVATPGNKTAGVSTDWTNFAPRLGFAATLGKGFVLRGGFGLAYSPENQGQNTQQPFNYSFSCTVGSSVNPCGIYGTSLAVGMPAPVVGNPNAPIQAVTIWPKQELAYVRMYNIFLQKQVGDNLFTLGWVGQRGNHFLDPINLNQPAPSAGAPLPFVYSTQAPLLTTITLRDQVGVSAYDAMELVYQRRYKVGFTLNANYTWSHGLSDFLAPGNSLEGSPDRGLVPSNPMVDYGNSGMDVRHRISLAATYELPFARSATGFLGAAVKGWQTNIAESWQTGNPFTVGNGGNGGTARINIVPITNDRPNVVAPLTLPNPTIAEWFNRNAFAVQNKGTLGDEAVDQLYGPHLSQTNASLFKTFKATERLSIQFRAEVFNVLNHPNFHQPNSTISNWVDTQTPARCGVSGTPTCIAYINSNPITPAGIVPSNAGGFGTITQTTYNSPPRQMQFAVKFLF